MMQPTYMEADESHQKKGKGLQTKKRGQTKKKARAGGVDTI